MRRIILDQGLAAPAALVLRDAGWDAIHVREISMHTASDAEILVYAAREGRVVVTLDRDFPQMLAFLGGARPSVVLIRQQKLRVAAITEILTAIWQDLGFLRGVIQEWNQSFRPAVNKPGRDFFFHHI